ncbi:Serine/threonine-protein kinase pim-2 [Liparis tanakae]|uniref:non-specific serine/threonine protein kinase n=1 Tax=Liparis tanakae TaxID=230148 RepID=A0A4Z2ILD0_9TELE|nr:Serine/threonine-protein kinase pim-2 [Liparis tanakae]
MTSFVEHSDCTTQPNHRLGTDCKVTKTSTIMNHPKSPRQRRRCAGEPADPKRTKRKPCTKKKAGTDSETPGKKRRGGTANSSEPASVSAESLKEAEKKAGAEQPPAAETPGRTRKESDRDLSEISGSTSSSQQNDGSTSISFTNRRPKFEDAYLQLKKLGQGGFGSVYAGKRISDNLPVAIKRIPKADVESRPLVSDDSAPTVNTIVQLHWYDLDQEVLLIMERPVPCVDLLTYLYNNDGPLSEDQAKEIMKQLVEAAIKMLSDKVFHRDIKTENILVETTPDGPRVRIIDFGCGCFVKKRTYYDYSGTSAYTPPEFYSTGRYAAGPTTVWQLGALLFELLDGHKQFITSEFLGKKINLNSELSQDCHNLLKMCLAINPRGRATLKQMQLHPWFK